MAGKGATAVAVLSGRRIATSLRRAGQEIHGQQSTLLIVSGR